MLRDSKADAASGEDLNPLMEKKAGGAQVSHPNKHKTLKQCWFACQTSIVPASCV